MKAALPLDHQTIVVTRPISENVTLSNRLTQLGATVVQFPTIITTTVQTDIAHAVQYDWVIITSVKAIDYFLTSGTQDIIYLQKINIAVVGPKTKKRAESFGLHVSFMPSDYNSTTLAQELPDVAGKKILLLRSDIAPQQLVDDLENRGAIVTDQTVYATSLIDTPDESFEKLIRAGKIDYITFTSPSTVKGFFTRLQSVDMKQRARAIPVISIGPLTTKAAHENGFTTIITAETHTVEGMIEKLIN